MDIFVTYIVICRVVPGGSEPPYNGNGHAKVGPHKSFLFRESSLVVRIKFEQEVKDFKQQNTPSVVEFQSQVQTNALIPPQHLKMVHKL